MARNQPGQFSREFNTYRMSRIDHPVEHCYDHYTINVFFADKVKKNRECLNAQTYKRLILPANDGASSLYPIEESHFSTYVAVQSIKKNRVKQRAKTRFAR